MKLVELSKQVGIDLFSFEGYEEGWERDKAQPRLVSTIDPVAFFRSESYAPAFYLGSEYAPGVWGAVDKNGRFLIKPQYLCAYPFRDNRAVVVKGKWEYRDDWPHMGKRYAGYWYESESWGVIDEAGNEVITCEHDYIEGVSHEDKKEIIVKVLDNSDGLWQCELFSANTGKVLVNKDKDYSDFGGYLPEDEYGQILSATGGSLRDWGDIKNLKVGVFDLNKLEDIISPQYGYVEIVDKWIYQVGDADEYGDPINGILINCQNQKILDRDDIYSAWLHDDGVCELIYRDRTKELFKLETGEAGLPMKLTQIQ